MDKKPYYVILTGSKNNAGDYLIKYRAKQLFASLRPDREIVDIDGWKPFDTETLKVVNESKALILMGGPSLQPSMYPKIYPLADSLAQIKAPITTMGIGWKSLRGEWKDTRSYSLTPLTRSLLKKINESGLQASVRDYHTQNVLQGLVSRTVMTGCPATYDLNQLGQKIKKPDAIRRVGFSLGVSFLQSQSLKEQMKASILKAEEFFRNADFEVVFHHSLKDEFLSTHNASSSHLKGHREFSAWLDSKNIKYVDISGSAENLVNYYTRCDLHIGYRVHAHIFMSSISKPSVLVAEDGRGKALRNVFGSVVLDAFEDVGESKLSKLFRKLHLSDTFSVYPNFDKEMIDTISYEIINGFPRTEAARKNIDSNYTVMERFIKSLP